MKKVILGIAMVGLCTSFTNTVKAQESTTPTAIQQEQEETIEIPEPPKFANDEVNKGVGELVSLIKEYAPAIQANDSIKMTEFGNKIQIWQQNAASWVINLTPEEKEKFEGYMQQVDTALQPTTPAEEEDNATPEP